MQRIALAAVERRLTALLTGWALLSMLLGGMAAFWGKRTGRKGMVQFGRQTAGWGAIDGAIAGVGTLARHRRGDLSDAQVVKQARSLRRMLWANAAADVGYVLGGAELVRRARAGRAPARFGAGDGLAMIVQGLFLFVLDVTHARRAR